MPKESKTISHHNKQPYPESSAPQQTNAKKNVEFVWESYEQQSPLKSKPNFPSPSNSSGGMTQLLGFQDDDPINGFSFSTPSTSGELMNPFPTSDNDLKLSPPNTTTAEDPFKKHNDLSSLTSASFHIACTACREKHIKCGTFFNLSYLNHNYFFRQKTSSLYILHKTWTNMSGKYKYLFLSIFTLTSIANQKKEGGQALRIRMVNLLKMMRAK